MGEFSTYGEGNRGELTELFDRITSGSYSEHDVERLRELSVRGNKNTVQVGRYNVSLGQGRDIHIGDRVYRGPDAEVLRGLLREVSDPVSQMPLFIRVLFAVGAILCFVGLGIFFYGLAGEMTRPPEEALREGGVEMGRTAATAFRVFLLGFGVALAGVILNWFVRGPAGRR